jgi:hypothetical protein
VKYLKADKSLTTDKASGVDCVFKGTTILCDGKAMKTVIAGGDMGGSLSFAGTSGSSYTVDPKGWIKMAGSKQFYLTPSGSGIQVENCPHGHFSVHGYPKVVYN